MQECEEELNLERTHFDKTYMHASWNTLRY